MTLIGTSHFESYMRSWWDHFDEVYFMEQSQNYGFYHRLAQKFGPRWLEINEDTELSDSLEKTTDYVFK